MVTFPTDVFTMRGYIDFQLAFFSYRRKISNHFLLRFKIKCQDQSPLSEFQVRAPGRGPGRWSGSVVRVGGPDMDLGWVSSSGFQIGFQCGGLKLMTL